VGCFILSFFDLLYVLSLGCLSFCSAPWLPLAGVWRTRGWLRFPCVLHLCAWCGCSRTRRMSPCPLVGSPGCAFGLALAFGGAPPLGDSNMLSPLLPMPAHAGVRVHGWWRPAAQRQWSALWCSFCQPLVCGRPLLSDPNPCGVAFSRVLALERHLAASAALLSAVCRPRVAWPTSRVGPKAPVVFFSTCCFLWKPRLLPACDICCDWP